MRIKFDFSNNKILLRKNNENISEGELKFENNILKEIVFLDSEMIENSEIIKTWSVLTTVNKLYEYNTSRADKLWDQGLFWGLVFMKK